MQLRLALPRVPPSRLQPNVAAHVAALAKTLRILQRQQVSQRDQRSHSLHLFQPRHLRITFPSNLPDLLVVFVNPLAQRFDGCEQRFQRRLQLRTQLACCLGIQVAWVAAAQPLPIRLRQSARCVDQRRPRPYQSSPRSNHHQMRLGLRTSMLHRRQQLRIDPRQSRQRAGVEAIIFPPTLPDQAHVARMRHDHFMSQLAQHPAHPRRMHSRLQRDPAPWHSPEHFFHRLRSRAQLLFQQHFPRFIQHAIPARAIPQIQTNRQLLLCKILVLPGRYSANLLHCRSPLSLAPSSASITWERTASRRRPVFSSHLIASLEKLQR